jgi:hypothetical protein
LQYGDTSIIDGLDAILRRKQSTLHVVVNDQSWQKKDANEEKEACNDGADNYDNSRPRPTRRCHRLIVTHSSTMHLDDAHRRSPAWPNAHTSHQLSRQRTPNRAATPAERAELRRLHVCPLTAGLGRSVTGGSRQSPASGDTSAACSGVCASIAGRCYQGLLSEPTELANRRRLIRPTHRVRPTSR